MVSATPDAAHRFGHGAGGPRILDLRGAVQAVIFDIGVSLSTRRRRGWPQQLGSPTRHRPHRLESFAQEIRKRGEIGETSLEQVLVDTADALDVAPMTVEAMFDDMWYEYLGTANTELIGYLAALRPRYRTALLSNSFVGAREREQARFGFDQLVDVVVYSHEEGVRKPDPRIYRSTWAQLDVAPDSVVFVDDVVECVAGARAIGMHAVHHVDNRHTIAAIEALLANDR